MRICGGSRLTGRCWCAFSTMAGLFDDNSATGEAKHYQPDEYRLPYLKQEVAAGHPDPISRWVRYFSRRSKLEASTALDALAKLCGGPHAGLGLQCPVVARSKRTSLIELKTRSRPIPIWTKSCRARSKVRLPVSRLR